jgi:hypothetical protein
MEILPSGEAPVLLRSISPRGNVTHRAGAGKARIATTRNHADHRRPRFSRPAAAKFGGAGTSAGRYTSNFGAYNVTYGSLGAAIGMMTWMWISMIVVLAGAQLNAEIERQTARTSTFDR